MTREEAIKQLKQIIDVASKMECNEKEIDAFDEEAINMAIQALKEQAEVEEKTAWVKEAMNNGWFDTKEAKGMTREEAIARIENHKILHKMNEPRAIYISEALDMAIKALEQEPCVKPTTEDAINAIKAIQELMIACTPDSKYYKVGEMAIWALSQEPCDDAISRQAVLDLIEHYNSDGLGSVFYGYERDVKFADAVNKLPPVTPEPKTGHCKDCK